MNESGVPRQDIYLTTKVWTSEFGLGKVIPSLEVSLEKLGTDPQVYYYSKREWVRKLGDNYLKNAKGGEHV